MAVGGTIALNARSELPLTWEALSSAPAYGDPFLQRKVNTVMVRLFGIILDEDEQDALDLLVADYAGKMVALQLVVPGIDYWSKQQTGVSATGRNETKTYKDRAQDLKDLQKLLLIETTNLWPDVQALLVSRRTNTLAAVPRVGQIGDTTVPNTSDPRDFEPAYAPPTDVTRRVP